MFEAETEKPKGLGTHEVIKVFECLRAAIRAFRGLRFFELDSGFRERRTDGRERAYRKIGIGNRIRPQRRNRRGHLRYGMVCRGIQKREKFFVQCFPRSVFRFDRRFDGFGLRLHGQAFSHAFKKAFLNVGKRALDAKAVLRAVSKLDGKEPIQICALFEERFPRRKGVFNRFHAFRVSRGRIVLDDERRERYGRLLEGNFALG